jgi:hypothetical protein
MTEVIRILPPGPYLLEVTEVAPERISQGGHRFYTVRLKPAGMEPLPGLNLYWNLMAGQELYGEPLVGRTFLFDVKVGKWEPTGKSRNVVGPPLAEVLS